MLEQELFKGLGKRVSSGENSIEHLNALIMEDVSSADASDSNLDNDSSDKKERR